MIQNKWCILISMGFLLCFCVSSTPIGYIKNSPNIVLLVADDQGWGDLGFNGNPWVNTPNIDSLAANGAHFDRFYVSPVCSPTRAELLTGRYHARSGVWETSAGAERMDLDETTIADMLKKNGYHTAAFGKWHNGMQYPYHPLGRGFMEFYGFCSGHWGNYFNPVLEHNGKIIKGNGFLPDDLTDKAIEYIKQNKAKPFFVYLPFNTPHSPMQVPDEWWAKYKECKLDTLQPYSRREIPDHTRAAYALTENIDWNVGRLLTTLSKNKLDENTIVIYMTDNGPNGYRWNGGMKGIKGSTDEGGTRSPFIIRWKNHIPKGISITPIASAIDIFPTLLDLLQIKIPSEKPIDGKSLKPLLLQDHSSPWANRFLVSYWKNKTSIRSQQYRLDAENKLYDMVADPAQTRDIAGNLPDVFKEMVATKRKWEQEILIELPATEQRPFILGHPKFPYYQLPARDAESHGGIQRSNRFPNSSYFKNWTSLHDSITWNVEVLESGIYEAIVYYTCSKVNIGSKIQLRIRNSIINSTIDKAHDSDYLHADKDRYPRQESYEKDFIPMTMGNIALPKGKGILSLKALSIPNKEAMEFRTLLLNRIR